MDSYLISIHALLAESDVTVLGIQHRVGISIHALLAESDPTASNEATNHDQISIHALLAESDANSQQEKNNGHEFLSTLSLRRATIHYDNYNLHCVISIHALLAESDRAANCQHRSHQISIHALLAESDAAPWG